MWTNAAGQAGFKTSEIIFLTALSCLILLLLAWDFYLIAVRKRTQKKRTAALAGSLMIMFVFLAISFALVLREFVSFRSAFWTGLFDLYRSLAVNLAQMLIIVLSCFSVLFILLGRNVRAAKPYHSKPDAPVRYDFHLDDDPDDIVEERDMFEEFGKSAQDVDANLDRMLGKIREVKREVTAKDMRPDEKQLQDIEQIMELRGESLQEETDPVLSDTGGRTKPPAKKKAVPKSKPKQ